MKVGQVLEEALFAHLEVFEVFVELGKLVGQVDVDGLALADQQLSSVAVAFDGAQRLEGALEGGDVVAPGRLFGEPGGHEAPTDHRRLFHEPVKLLQSAHCLALDVGLCHP